MTDNERDDLDRQLAAGLSALAPDVADPTGTLESMRPGLRRARVRHRAARVSALVAVLLVFGAVAAVAANRGTRTHVRVESSSTTALPGTTAHQSTSTSVPSHASTSVPHPNQSTQLATVTTQPGVVPPPPGSPTTIARPGPGSGTTVAPANALHTYVSDGGRITVRFQNGALTLVSRAAAPGFTAEVASERPDDVEVRFRNDQGEWRIRVRVDSNGQLQPAEITRHG